MVCAWEIGSKTDGRLNVRWLGKFVLCAAVRCCETTHPPSSNGECQRPHPPSERSLGGPRQGTVSKCKTDSPTRRVRHKRVAACPAAVGIRAATRSGSRQGGISGARPARPRWNPGQPARRRAPRGRALWFLIPPSGGCGTSVSQRAPQQLASVRRRDSYQAHDSIGPQTTQYRRCGPARLRRHTRYWLS